MFTIIFVCPMHRQVTDTLPTGCQQVTDCRPTVGQHNTLTLNITQTVDRLLANSRPTGNYSSLLPYLVHQNHANGIFHVSARLIMYQFLTASLQNTCMARLKLKRNPLPVSPHTHKEHQLSMSS